MDEGKVIKLTSLDLPPRLVTAINSFDEAITQAIDDVIAAGVHRGMIVGMLHGYAHYQTQVLCDNGYA